MHAGRRGNHLETETKKPKNQTKLGENKWHTKIWTQNFIPCDRNKTDTESDMSEHTKYVHL